MTGYSKQLKRREILFNIYSKNFSFVKKHPNIKIEPDLDNIYVCPFCFNIFTEEQIFSKGNSFMTLEHLPPEKLGGKKTTMTCKQCNNTAGSNLDSNLINKLSTENFLGGNEESLVNTKIVINDIVSINGYAKFQKDKNLQLIGIPDNTDPSEYKKLENIKKDEILTFTIQFSGGFKKGHPEASILRIAYLWGFSVFGYGFLINSSFPIIRYQIKNPTEKVLPNWGIIGNFNVPNEFLGINLITAPIEVRSFCVVFDLEINNIKKRYGVLLPGYSDPGINIYKINPIGPKISLKHISEKNEYLTKKEMCFESHLIWKYWH